MKKKAVLLSLVCSIVLSGCGGCGNEVSTEVIESESVIETSVGYSEEESTVIEEETTVEETTVEETTIEEETTETTVEEETVIETTIEETTEAVAEVVEPAEQAPQNSQPSQQLNDLIFQLSGGALDGSGGGGNASGTGEGAGYKTDKPIVLH